MIDEEVEQMIVKIYEYYVEKPAITNEREIMSYEKNVKQILNIF
jgi:hypothetical protein